MLLGVYQQDRWAPRRTTYVMPRDWPAPVHTIHDLDQLGWSSSCHVVEVEQDHRTGQFLVIYSDGTEHVVDEHLRPSHPPARRRHSLTR